MDVNNDDLSNGGCCNNTDFVSQPTLHPVAGHPCFDDSLQSSLPCECTHADLHNHQLDLILIIMSLL